MPVPGSYFNHDPAVLNAAPYQRNHPRIQQNRDAPGQVNRMCPGQDEKKWAGYAGEYVESAFLECSPCRPLTKQKNQTQRNRYAEPRNPELPVKGDSRNRTNRG